MIVVSGDELVWKIWNSIRALALMKIIFSKIRG